VSDNSAVVFINGMFVPKAQASVSLYDHGYLYGDGVFEGVRVYNGRVFRLTPHLERLLFSARALGFRMDGLSLPSLREAVLETCRRNNHQNGYIRITLSRGIGLGLDPQNIDQTPQLIILTQELRLYKTDLYESGLTMITCATRVPPPDVIDPRIKGTGKYINNIQAKMEANRVGAGEGLMLNQQGLVAEATGDNIFVITNGTILTPPPSAGCLKGITRGVAMELAQDLGLPVREENLSLYDVYNADECFLTGTAAEIIPAVALDQRPIASGKPGDLTRRLIDAFRAHTLQNGDPV
jgi:branched-chain amino acid aminotransferase